MCLGSRFEFREVAALTENILTDQAARPEHRLQRKAKISAGTIKHHSQYHGSRLQAVRHPHAIHARVIYVAKVIKGAVRNQEVMRNPITGIPLPWLDKDETKIPEPEEVGKIMNASDKHFRAFWAVCAFAGLRPGEAAGLKVQDVRWLQRELRIDRQVQPNGRGTVDIKPPKFGSRRTVYVPERLVKVLSAHVEHGTNGDWLFMGSHGNPPTHHAYAPHWSASLEAAGVGKFRVHDLRHFFASGLIAAGTDVVTVQRQLGHQSATVTLNRYSHLWNTHQEVTRSAVDAMMGQALGSGVGNELGKQSG